MRWPPRLRFLIEFVTPIACRAGISVPSSAGCLSSSTQGFVSSKRCARCAHLSNYGIPSRRSDTASKIPSNGDSATASR